MHFLVKHVKDMIIGRFKIYDRKLGLKFIVKTYLMSLHKVDTIIIKF